MRSRAGDLAVVRISLVVMALVAGSGCATVHKKVVNMAVGAATQAFKAMQPPKPVLDTAMMAHASKTNAYTAAKYKKLHMKMSLAQAQHVMGAPGQKMTQKAKSVLLATLDWYLWVNADRSYIELGFSDGVLAATESINVPEPKAAARPVHKFRGARSPKSGH